MFSKDVVNGLKCKFSNVVCGEKLWEKARLYKDERSDLEVMSL